MSTTLTTALLAATVRLAASHGYADGAPPGFSGGFKEDSCHACHFHEEPNAAPGRVTIDGVPPAFTPGQRYTITITLQRPGMRVAGFQAAARFENGGAQAGVLAAAAADAERIGVEAQAGVQYAGQKKAGTTPGSDGTVTWRLEWTAPMSAGTVVFHVSANAADGNGNAEGDFVYTTSAESAPPP